MLQHFIKAGDKVGGISSLQLSLPPLLSFKTPFHIALNRLQQRDLWLTKGTFSLIKLDLVKLITLAKLHPSVILGPDWIRGKMKLKYDLLSLQCRCNRLAKKPRVKNLVTLSL
jgi:hypothetical protein